MKCPIWIDGAPARGTHRQTTRLDKGLVGDELISGRRSRGSIAPEQGDALFTWQQTRRDQRASPTKCCRYADDPAERVDERRLDGAADVTSDLPAQVCRHLCRRQLRRFHFQLRGSRWRKAKRKHVCLKRVAEPREHKRSQHGDRKDSGKTRHAAVDAGSESQSL